MHRLESAATGRSPGADWLALLAGLGDWVRALSAARAGRGFWRGEVPCEGGGRSLRRRNVLRGGRTQRCQEAGALAQRPAHGARAPGLRQPIRPGGAAVGPGQGGKSRPPASPASAPQDPVGAERPSRPRPGTLAPSPGSESSSAPHEPCPRPGLALSLGRPSPARPTLCSLLASYGPCCPPRGPSRPPSRTSAPRHWAPAARARPRPGPWALCLLPGSLSRGSGVPHLPASKFLCRSHGPPFLMCPRLCPPGGHL